MKFSTGQMFGASFCFTGRFEVDGVFFLRAHLQEALYERGAVTHTEVGPETDYLVVGNMGSKSKTKKASALKKFPGVIQVSPPEFLQMLEQSEPLY